MDVNLKPGGMHAEADAVEGVGPRLESGSCHPAVAKFVAALGTEGSAGAGGGESGGLLQAAFERHAQEYAHVFDDVVDGEHSLAAIDSFNEWVKCYEGVAATVLEDAKVDEEEFYFHAQQARMENGNGKMVLDLCLSSLSFESYSKMMHRFSDSRRQGAASASDMGL